MKRIFLLLCLVAGSASASEYWVWRNSADWEFVLTFEKPDWCGGMDMMYSVSPQGNAHYGCWRMMNDRVHIEFRSGAHHVFSAEKFQRRAEKTNLLK